MEKDLSSANRYGAVKFLLDSKDHASVMPGQVRHKLAKALQDFRPEDYIFHPGGDNIAVLMAGSILRDLGFREVQWLKWDKERGTDGKPLPGGFYSPVKLPL